MACEKLGGRVNDDVGAMLERPAEVGGRQRVVDDERQARLMRDLRHGCDIDHDAARIGEVLDEDRLALRRQRLAEILGLGRIDEMAGPAELLEREAELGERAAIEVARGDELVARLHQGEEGQELRRVPRRGGDRRAAAFERGDALFQHRDGRVGEPRIDVAEIMQIKERGGVVDVVEHIGRRLIDRGRARAGGRIGRCAGMDGAGLEAVIKVVRRRRLLAEAMTGLLDSFRPAWLDLVPTGPAASTDGYQLTMVLYASAWTAGKLTFRASGTGLSWVGSVDMDELCQAVRSAGTAGIDGDVEICGEAVPVEVVEDAIQVPIGPFLVSGSADEWDEIFAREQATMHPPARMPKVVEQPWTGDRIALSISDTD